MYEKYPASILPPFSRILDPKSDMVLQKQTLISDIQMIMDIFTINSYCLSIEVSEIVKNSPKSSQISDIFPLTLKVIVRAPSNLWSDQALRKRKENPTNDFEIKVIKALCRKRNLRVESESTNVLNKIDVVHVIKIFRNS